MKKGIIAVLLLVLAGGAGAGVAARGGAHHLPEVPVQGRLVVEAGRHRHLARRQSVEQQAPGPADARRRQVLARRDAEGTDQVGGVGVRQAGRLVQGQALARPPPTARRWPGRCPGPSSPRTSSPPATTATTAPPCGPSARTGRTWWASPCTARATRWTRCSRARGRTPEHRRPVSPPAPCPGGRPARGVPPRRGPARTPRAASRPGRPARPPARWWSRRGGW